MNKSRPALLLVTASLIPLIILAAVMGTFFIQEQRTALDEDIRSRASSMAATLQRELENQIRLLSVVADSPRLDPPIPRTAFAETARRLRERIPEWEQIRISDEKGEVVLSSPTLDVPAERQIVDMESHDTVIRTKAAVIGNVSIGPKGQAAFAVRVPIIRGDRLKAVVSVVIRPNIVTNLLHANGLPSSWSAWIVDGQDRIVTSTGTPTLAGSAASEFASFSGSGFGSAVMKSGDSLRVAEAALESTPWRVRVGLPLAEYDRLARRATILLVVASCFTLLLSGSAVWLFYREARARNLERESLANWQRMDALGKLTGQAAHDFNNLLMVFQSGVEGIQRRRDDAQRVDRFLSHMGQGVARGKAITQRLLSFSRRSNQAAGYVDLDEKLTELTPLLKQALDDTITLNVRIPDDVWPIHADPTGLEIALINFLTNAREAMPSGGGVAITARNVPDGEVENPALRGEFVALTISDTGSGVATEHLARVFEPFFSTKKNGEPGLGLTQVHSFATGSGGAVKVASVIGHGTAFTLILPRSMEQRTPKEKKPVVELSSAILIVDDTPSSLESVRLSLDGLVPKIFLATGGNEALDALQRNSEIDAVVSDIMMPEMSGIELAEQIRLLNPDLPVVLMTGYSDKLEAGAELGRPVIAKPFEINDLATALGKARAAGGDADNVIRLEIPSKG